MFCLFHQEEDFTGFGTTTVRPQKTSQPLLLSQTKSPPVSDQSPEAKRLIGKILPKAPKPAPVGKIVPRLSKRRPGVNKNPEKVKEISRVVIKLHGKNEALTAKAKLADSTRSADFISKTRKTAVLGNIQNQTVATSAGGSKQDKVVSTLTAVKGTEKASEVRERGEALEDSDTGRAQPQRSVKQMRGFQLGHTTRRTSQTLPFISLQKKQRKRRTKDVGASPETGAQTSEEAARPLESKAADSSQRRRHRRSRKSLYGYKRKSAPAINKQPKLGRNRTRRVFYTYVSEPITTTMEEGTKLQDHNITASEGDSSLFTESNQQSSNGSVAPVMSARSSRVIKTPKRFLDEEVISFPKGSLSTWLKTQQRDDGKPSTSLYDSVSDGNMLRSESDPLSVFDSPSPVAEFSSKPIPGTSHLEIYKNLKKLTLKLAEKKKAHPESQEENVHGDDGLTSHIKKRRRSKLMMEEMDSPGVVRKLAVVVNTDVDAPTHMPFEEIGNNSKDQFSFV